MLQQLTFGSKTIAFTLEYRKRKSLGIKVHPDSRVEVLAPLKATDAQVFSKLKTKAPWIIKQLDYFKSYKPATPPRLFINGETHLYLGRQYRLKIVTDNTPSVKAYRGQLWIHSKSVRPQNLNIQLDEWYKQKALVVFADLLQETLPKFRRYKIAEPVLAVRAMSKRWGSCTPAGKIILNTELIKAPKGCIEYVIIHELCHLVHHNHAKDFHRLLNRMLPDWKKWKEKLEYTLI